MNTLKFGNGEWYGKKDTILAYNDENSNFKPLPFSFDRDTTATRINKEGLIETVGSGEPRIDYKDDSKGALLLEPSRTNIVTNSELLNTYFTTKSATTVITDNYGIAPNGLQSSSRIQFGASDYCLRGLSLSTNSTSSVYVKGISGETIQFGVGANVAQGGIFTFNGSWQRIEYTYQNGSGSILFSNLNALATATDFEAFGLQVEDNSSYATSYIPTQGSAVTRVADVCNNGANEQVINSTEGVLYAEIAALNSTSSSSQYISISDGTYNNRASILFSNGATNQIRTFLRVGGTSQIDVSNNVSDVTDFNKVAFLYKENDFKVYINGSLVSSDTSGSVWSANTITKLSFSEINTSANKFEGKVKDLKLYNTALTDQELINLTTI